MTTQKPTSKFGAKTIRINKEAKKKLTEEGQTYLCEICGNKVKVLESGAGTLVCCGQDMTLLD